MSMRSAPLLLLAALAAGGQGVAPAADDAENLFAGSPRVLTKAQLDSLVLRAEFSSHWLEEQQRAADLLRANPADEDLQQHVAWRKQHRAELEQSPIALYLPKHRFRLDEPVHAYFVVKNASAEPIDLDMRLDLQLGLRTVNACRVELRRVEGAGEESESRVSEHLWQCGGPSHLTLPAKGYYCLRADLRRLGVSRPGEYAIRWGFSGLTSREVKFTVVALEDGKTVEKPVRAVRVARITRGDEPRERVAQLRDAEPAAVVEAARLAPLSFSRFAAGLAVEAEGVLYPDVLDLPGQDSLVTAGLHFERPRDAGPPATLVLTLTPRQKNAGLFLKDFDHLVLLAASRSEVEKLSHDGEREQQEDAKVMHALAIHSLTDPKRPLRIRIELEENWPRRLGLSGPVELRVILSSEPIRLQGEWPQLRSIEKKELFASGRMPWRGLLCTPAVSVDLPADEVAPGARKEGDGS
ncbi:MAG: hypothetical protein RIC55_04985 [Pirellulaceae bacterium]